MTIDAAQRRFIVAGILVVFLLSALDQTIVSTAMPRIVSDLHGLELYAWVTTAYLLTSTVMVPIWGKLSDLVGRKPVLLGAILFFVAGSCLAGMAGEFGPIPLLGDGMTQLVVFRAIQGIGGGGLFSTAFTIIADVYPPDKRARLGGMLGGIFGLASAVGPLIGGYFTDHGTVHWLGHEIAGWRWVFYINFPLSLLSLFIVVFRMPEVGQFKKGRLDILGAILIVAAVVPMLLALTWGGQKYAWTSPQVIGLAAMSLGALLGYIIAERHTADPILPMNLFGNRVFASANLAAFLVSMSFVSAVAFLPLFLQIALGVSATASGLLTLPLMIGLMGSAMISGPLVERTGAYKATLLTSVVLVGISLALLARMNVHTTNRDVAWRMLLLGIGLGPAQGLFGVVVQNATPARQLGVVTSASQFFRQIGSTMGVALFGTVLTGNLNANLGAIMPGMDMSRLQAMRASPSHAPAPSVVREAVANAFSSTLLLGLAVVALALIATALIPIPPRRKRPLDGTSSDDGLFSSNVPR